MAGILLSQSPCLSAEIHDAARHGEVASLRGRWASLAWVNQRLFRIVVFRYSFSYAENR
jgi:hypothetical protein